MKHFGKVVLKYIISAIAIFVIAVLATSYIKDKQLSFDISYITKDGIPFIVTFVAEGLLLVFDLMKLIDGKSDKKTGKAEDKVKDEKGKETKQFFSRDFLTDEDLAKNKDFNPNTIATLRNCKKDGILVRAQLKGNTTEINFVQPIHTLVVGTTSAGKTQRFVVPSLQLMSMTAAKPSFVITDPKGELYNLCANKLKNEGYDVKVLDLRTPFASVQWNPLTYPYDMYTRSFNLDKEVKVHPAGDNPKNHNVIIQRQFDFTTNAWFEFDGKAYVDKEILEQDQKVLARELVDKAFDSINDTCTTIAPIESGKDPSWEKAAQNLIKAVIIAMLEDSRIPELGMTREKFNFYNVAKICNITDSGRDTYATIKQYLFNYRDQFSKVHDLASTALQNAESTTKNYMGFVSNKMVMFNDTGICFLTEKTEVDFVQIDEKPTAIFLIIPDEIRTRYSLAILFVTQLYKRLVEKAQSLGGELKRHVYFMLDEFGNMPKFPEWGSTMTVGRSRGIFFELCVQSYSQLYQVYGQDEGKIIKDNCPIQVYIASEDTTTNKEFSELLGKKTIVQENVNKSVGPDGKESKSYSSQNLSIPIAYPEQLPTFRDEGKVAIKTFTPNAALKTTITPAYLNKCFDLTKIGTSYSQKRLLDEAKVFYDIKSRNSLLAKQNGADEDDDDDDDLF